MYSRLYSAAVYGITAFIVEIETHLEQGLPAFQVVGLPDATVKEARERVAAALANSGIPFPSKRVTVNLAPANVKKEGSGFDFPLALGILASLEFFPQEEVEKTILIGELALDGSLRTVTGIIAITMQAKAEGFERILLPAENAREAAFG